MTEATFFKFEEDFIEDNIRCIPMIVRFKLDKVGIKLKLSEWCKMNTEQRNQLACLPCEVEEEVKYYRNYLMKLVKNITGEEATPLQVNGVAEWSTLNRLPLMLQQKLKENKWEVELSQWKSLTTLQRFALVKLSAASHEQKNLPRALHEFGVINL